MHLAINLSDSISLEICHRKGETFQRIFSPLAHHKMAKKNSKNKPKEGKITLIDCQIFSFFL